MRVLLLALLMALARPATAQPVAGAPEDEPLFGWPQGGPPASAFKVTLVPARPGQGSVVLVSVAGPPGFTVTGSFRGHEVPFSRWTPDGPQRALLGLDVQLPPAGHDLAIVAASGQVSRRLAVVVPVVARSFATQKLTVPKQMVSPTHTDSSRIENDSSTIRDAISEITPGRFAGPFQRPVPGAVTSTFGVRRILNGYRKGPHVGVDLRAPEGTPVKAPAGGTVALVRDLFCPGKSVFIDHGMGLFTHYAHLSSVAVAEGQEVRAGQVIARSGKTGRVTGPHLHWAAILLGVRVDPLDLTRPDRFGAGPSPVPEADGQDSSSGECEEAEVDLW